MRAFFIAVLVSVVTAQTPQTGQFKIKGHQIGESTADFLKLEAATQNELNDCHSNAPKPISVEEVQRRKFPSGTTKREYLELARQGRLFDKDVQGYNRKCGSLLSLFDSNGKGDVTTEYPIQPGSITKTNVTWKFEAAKLVGLNMFVFGRYGDVRDDVTTKAGLKPTESAIPYHNGFGAQWNDMYAEWTTQTVHVMLTEDNNPASASHLPFLMVETRAKYDAEKKVKTAQGSPLD